MGRGAASKDISQMGGRFFKAPWWFDALSDWLAVENIVDFQLAQVFEGAAVFLVETMILLTDDDPVFIREAI